MAAICMCPSAFCLSSPNSSNMRRGKHSRVICEVGSDLSRVQTANVAHLDGTSQLKISRRQTALSLGSITLLSLTLPLVAFPAFGLLEADDDEELLEKVKEDRKKRLQKSEQTNTLKNETVYVQDAIYKLSEVGQAIDNNDFQSATRVLGKGLDTKWIVNVKEVFSKVSTNPEEISNADTFAASLASLISAVSKQNLDLSKSAFVSSANALENWSALTGLSEQLKGL